MLNKQGVATQMKITLLSTLLCCPALVSSVCANLVTNGDFEDPVVASQATGFQTYLGGESFPGWTVGGVSIDVVGDNPFAWVSWPAASGHQSVDLNGTGPGWIYQDIHTVAGEAYQLSFALAGNNANGPTFVTMDFLWQGQIVDTLTFNVIGVRQDPGWVYATYDLTASTDLARLTFESLVPWGTAGAAIDDVALRPSRGSSIPDHSSRWLALLLPIALHATKPWRRFHRFA